jgi:putative spermidine/putrescine transport system ATP-binding protein
MLDVVQLAHLGDRKPAQLSGGQQQRVALARALLRDRPVLLLDEPFAALDKNLRLDMQIEIKRLQRKFALTTILVTHDQDEAMSIADRIAVMNRGRVEQFDTPVGVYDRPRTRFVNGFIGSSNLLAGTVEGRDGTAHRVRLDAGVIWEAHDEAALPEGTRVVLSIRPEQLSLHETSAAGRLPVTVDLAMPIAGSVVHDLRCADRTEMKALGIRTGAAAFPVGARVHCAPAPECRPRLFPEDVSNQGEVQ